MPAEKFDFPQRPGPKARRAARPAGWPVRAVALFAHCFTCGKSIGRRAISPMGSSCTASPCCASISPGSAPAKANSPTHVLVECRRSGRRRRSFAQEARRAGDPDRPQPRRRRGAGRRAPHPRGARRGDDRRAVRSGPCHRAVRRAGRRDRQTRTRSRSRWPGGRSASAAACSTISPSKISAERIADLHKALLVFHSPTDDTVGIDNASQIFLAAKHPKSFISLAGADHLISRAERRHLCGARHRGLGRALSRHGGRRSSLTTTRRPGTVVVRETRRGKFQQEVIVGEHRLLADEPVKDGGLDSGPGPLRSAARRARRLHLDDGAALCRPQANSAQAHAGPAAAREDLRHGLRRMRNQRGQDRPHRSRRSFEGDLTAEQRKRLMEIADKCPVHRTLKSEVDIRTVEVAADRRRIERDRACRQSSAYHRRKPRHRPRHCTRIGIGRLRHHAHGAQRQGAGRRGGGDPRARPQERRFMPPI